jgi:hypothetical protein
MTKHISLGSVFFISSCIQSKKRRGNIALIIALDANGSFRSPFFQFSTIFYKMTERKDLFYLVARCMALQKLRLHGEEYSCKFEDNIAKS